MMNSIEEDPNSISAAPLRGEAAASSPMDTKDVLSKLTMALALSAIKTGGKTGKEILDLLGSISDTTLENVARVQQGTDSDFSRLHNLPPELAPIASFGATLVSTSDLKWLMATLATIKSRSPSLEDKLRTLKRLHVRSDNKFTEA